MAESIKSKYKPSYPSKYKGDPTNIICRSSWERKFCRWCDLNENILQWGSEEFHIPYISPLDRRVHKYFPDFIIMFERDGNMITEMIEVKPKAQVDGPNPNPKRRTAAWMRSVQTYLTNMAKWEAAAKVCEDRGWNFRLVTEKDLGI